MSQGFQNYPVRSDTLELCCGGHAVPDPDSGTHSLICLDCLTVVGSMGMPKHCHEAFEKERVWEKLKK